MRKFKLPEKDLTLGYDVRILFSVLFLTGIGIVMVYSASSALALKKFGTGYYFLKKQAIFALTGLLVMGVFRYISLRILYLMTYPLIGCALFFLIAIQVSGLGFAAGGAMRWMRIGSFTFQPSEFARFVMVLYMAYSMTKKQDKLKEFSIGFMPHVMLLGVFTMLILLQPDFGSAMILVAIGWMMMFVGGVPFKHLATSLLIFLPLACVFLFSASYRIKRLTSFLNPWQYASGEGYQIVHSLMAFGTGGFWGVGIGKGYQKLFYLPEPHTDFIFSVIGEELGLLGVILILTLYAIIVWRGFDIAKKAQDPFASLLAFGLISAFGLQVCINMGVTLSLLPTKGLTLPFLSYGGTSLLMNMASMGILMNIAASEKVNHVTRA
ncbi:MAG: putative lipid II flippase FtsW [Desulfobacteraceae bacterium IS3]|nr:MAG: putative lipid II flippase FtsW [Desulfobacteraceae bacterium IS3]